MSVKVTGDEEVKRKLLSLGDKMTEAVDLGVYATAEDIRDTAVKSIQTVSSGRVVKRSKQGGGTYDHIAAAPGNAPNTDSGKLVESIATEKKDDAFYEVGTSLPYGNHLEVGTKKMLPRPWLVPAMNAKADELIKNISEVADHLIKKMAAK